MKLLRLICLTPTEIYLRRAAAPSAAGPASISGSFRRTAGVYRIGSAGRGALPSVMTPHRWLRAGIVALVAGQALVWLVAASIWWSFRGFMRGGPSSPGGVADAYFAAAFRYRRGDQLCSSLAVLRPSGPTFRDRSVRNPGRECSPELCLRPTDRRVVDCPCGLGDSRGCHVIPH